MWGGSIDVVATSGKAACEEGTEFEGDEDMSREDGRLEVNEDEREELKEDERMEEVGDE